MRPKRILFSLEQQYGHINPTLGIAMELLRRGHDVCYTVLESFVPLIRGIGATALVVDIPENRDQVLSTLYYENDHLNLKVRREEIAAVIESVTRERLDAYEAELERLFRHKRPDLVVRDDIVERAGRAFSERSSIPSVLIRTQFITSGLEQKDVGEKLVLVTVPKFFQPIDDGNPPPSRFKFVGLIPEGRTAAFQRWRPLDGDNPRVLISPTTGMRRQVEFCRSVAAAFHDRQWDVVLSISGSHDTASAIDPGELGYPGQRIHINKTSANFDVLPDVDLYIGQGGQGGSLEAIYHGVPQIVVPPTPYHHSVARRVSDLGLGVCLPPAELSKETLQDHSARLLADEQTRQRLVEARDSMQADCGAEVSANLLEDFLGGAS